MGNLCFTQHDQIEMKACVEMAIADLRQELLECIRMEFSKSRSSANTSGSELEPYPPGRTPRPPNIMVPE